MYEKVEVFEKDPKLEPLHDYAKEKYLGKDIRIHNVNLTKMASDALGYGHQYDSPLSRILGECDGRQVTKPDGCLGFHEKIAS